MLVFLAAFFIAIARRFQGGGVFLLPGETTIERDGKDNKHTQIRRLGYAGCVGIVSFNPFTAAAAFLASLTGWGFPISAAIGKRGEKDFEEEFLPFDIASKWIVEKIYGEYYSKPYGVTWLTIHGFFTGLLFAISYMILAAIQYGPYESLAYFNPLFLGMSLMGACFYLTCDWEKGEILDGALKGAILGATTTIQIMNLL